jgi:hypothetical protein
MSSLVNTVSIHRRNELNVVERSTQLGLPNPLITGILQCVYTHPINLMGIHFLPCIHGNKHIGTHDAICNTFATITQNVGFHVG